MPFRVEEIRDRAQRLQSALAQARYRLQGGLEERSSLAALYHEHRLLLASGVLPAIQRELSEAYGDERQRLKALFNWVAGRQIEAELAPLEDELRSWETGATVSVAEREIPLRRVADWVIRADDRHERIAWEAARDRRIEESGALRLDVVHREREAVARLGLGEYIEARERLASLDLRRMERQATEILRRTEALYRTAFAEEVDRRIARSEGPPTRGDALWLMGMRWLGRSFEIQPLYARLRRDLDLLGLPLKGDGSVRVDFDRRPLKDERTFTAAIDVPGEVVLVVCPLGGWTDARGLLHELGHTLHYTRSSPALAWEERALGDVAVGEAFAFLFEALTQDAAWMESTTGLSGDALAEYRSLVGFLQLFRLRREAARHLWELDLARAERPGQLADRYAQHLSDATGFVHHPVTYLRDHRRGFHAARRLRGWMLSAIMLDRLQKRFGPRWYGDAQAGQYLGEVLSAGQRENAAELATQLGADGLTAEPLLARAEGWR
ncbi:hypothetical protein [Candidatus Palauibacter sp.]|uniref:hypothetical protein n=1 Tax=Candidatus Palauibacter sp. TaxID=3101350 RepID=UPI003B01973E